MVSHRICLQESLQKSILKQCKLLFINTPFPGQAHSEQINILGWILGWGVFCFLPPPCIFLPEAAASITMVNWMTRSSSAIHHSSNDCFLTCFKQLLIFMMCISVLKQQRNFCASSPHAVHFSLLSTPTTLSYRSATIYLPEPNSRQIFFKFPPACSSIIKKSNPLQALCNT